MFLSFFALQGQEKMRTQFRSASLNDQNFTNEHEGEGFMEIAEKRTKFSRSYRSGKGTQKVEFSAAPL